MEAIKNHESLTDSFCEQKASWGEQKNKQEPDRIALGIYHERLWHLSSPIAFFFHGMLFLVATEHFIYLSYRASLLQH
jgi:hypothetical protein